MKGVKQGCSLSPPLFKLHSEEAINEINEEIKNIGVKVQRKTIEISRFADDIALLANTERELEKALNVTETVFNNYNMKINIRKTKLVACKTKSGKKRLNIKIDKEKIGDISEFCYLGSKIPRDGRYRIGKAKRAFATLPQLLVSNIDLDVRKKLLKTYK